jgi:hypothetical protein
MVRRIDPEILRAADILVAAGYRWPTDNIEDLLQWIADAQRAADVAAKRVPTADGGDFSTFDFPAVAFVRSCPDGVNPFAAPPLMAKLYYLWRDLRLDEYGLARNARYVGRQQFEEILRTIRETVPRVSRGRAGVGRFELDQRRLFREEAARLAPMLENVLERVDRPAEYETLEEFEKDIRERGSPLHAREIAEAAWHHRIKRGPLPIQKIARRLAKALLPRPFIDPSTLIERVHLGRTATVAAGRRDGGAPRPRKRRAKF